MLLALAVSYLRWLAQEPFVALTVTAVVVGAMAAAHYGWDRPQRRRTEAAMRDLAAARAGQSICEFSRDFDLRAVDTWIVRAVYEALQEEIDGSHGLPAFPVRADDRMVADLHIDPEDLDLSVIGIAADRACRSLENWTTNPFRDDTATVRGLVLLLNAQPMVRPKTAA
jgi:hypothetical protein